MSKVILQKGNILDFKGDGVIIPSYTELSYKKGSKFLISLFEKAGEDLEKELSSIGFGEIGYAVITKGYNFPVKNIIFLPYQDHNDPQIKTDLLLTHQALRNAFNLATLYNLKKLAMILAKPDIKKSNFFENILIKSGIERTATALPSHETMDIASSVFEEYKGRLEELIIYN